MARQPNTPADDQEQARIPNYGRGAAFGLLTSLAAGIGWAILIEVTGNLNFGIVLAIGWMVGAAVKRGMGNVDRLGVGITLYGTLAAVAIAMFIYLAMRISDHGGTVTFTAVVGAFFIALKDPKFLLIFLGFTFGGCCLGVAVCKEGMPDYLKRKKKK